MRPSQGLVQGLGQQGFPEVPPAGKSVDDSGGNVHNGGKFSKSSPTYKPAGAGRSGGPRVWNYCHGGGHWKDQCCLNQS